VPWSSGIGPTTQSYAFGAPAIAYTPRRLDLYDRQGWELAAIVSIAATLVITALIWQHATMLDGQRRFEQSTSVSSFLPEAFSKTKSAPDYLGRPSAVAKSVDQTGLTRTQSPEELDEATISTELGHATLRK
jgi:hypothetical protein